MKTLSITQNEELLTVLADKGYCHLENSNNQLKLYTPTKEDDYQLCLNRDLPMGLTRYLEIQSAPQGHLASIITLSGLKTVDEFLDGEGIIELKGVEKPKELGVDLDIAGSTAPFTAPASDVSLPVRSVSSQDSTGVSSTSLSSSGSKSSSNSKASSTVAT